MKKLISILLSLSIIASICLTNIPAFCEYYGDFVYTTGATNTTIIDYTGPGGDVTIPGTVDGKTVTMIGEGAFFGYSNITSITIEDGPKYIAEYAFANCTGLVELSIPKTVEQMIENCLNGCTALKNIYGSQIRTP